MATETKLSLTQETLDLLNDLAQVNIDSRDGFRHAAGEISEMSISHMFVQLADERDRNLQELRSLINMNGETAENDGSFAAAAHRTWMDLRTALGGGVQTVLDEAERGEDHIKAKYEDALKKNAGTAVSDVLHRQYTAVKAAHDRVRDMRDAHRDA
jgi:uncharacterized protein (TIGR02284 family)